MRVLLDTNVIIDFYEEREPFLKAAEQLLLLCAEEKCTGLVSASAMTDIYFLLSKSLGKDIALDCIKKLLAFLEVADVGGSDIAKAAGAQMPDFEDAVVSFCAKRAKAEYIVTRNQPDFEGGPVPAISPTDFLEKHNLE